MTTVRDATFELFRRHGLTTMFGGDTVSPIRHQLLASSRHSMSRTRHSADPQVRASSVTVSTRWTYTPPPTDWAQLVFTSRGAVTVTTAEVACNALTT